MPKRRLALLSPFGDENVRLNKRVQIHIREPMVRHLSPQSITRFQTILDGVRRGGGRHE